MNTIVTSREEILLAAKDLILRPGAAGLNMRALALACGISVGSVYNYFPTKTDLMIAIVSDIWQDIFPPALCQTPGTSFLHLVARFSDSIRAGITAYAPFFKSHALVIDDKSQGRVAMEQYFHRMEQVLCQTLLADPEVRPGIWSDAFSPADCAAFVFDFLRTDLLQGRDRSALLQELLRRILY